jgi:hypothetical protein
VRNADADDHEPRTVRTASPGVAAVLNPPAGRHGLPAGTPRDNDGKHTVAAVGAEAGISRQRLYEDRVDLVAGFKIAARRRPIGPTPKHFSNSWPIAANGIDRGRTGVGSTPAGGRRS